MKDSLGLIKYAYFIGIGGIGMSAIARYFLAQGMHVSGYDRTQTGLTEELTSLGIAIHYEDKIDLIPQEVLDNKDETLIIYTPAIPNNHQEYNYFASLNYSMMKRSKVLGLITQSQQGLCVAGTHGKTTTSTILAHLLYNTPKSCNAFLGGIAANYKSNLLLAPQSNLVVVEADEYDRSFLQLNPADAIITSVDADHLDIYHEKNALVQSFQDFTALLKPNGRLLVRKGLEFTPQCLPSVNIYYYSLNEICDFYASNIHIINGLYQYCIYTPWGVIEEIELGMPGLINIENSVAATALALMNGACEEDIRTGLKSFRGIARRFEYKLRTESLISIDDYAHHPTEIASIINSVRDLYPTLKITGIFQPHLYSRTRDFADDFARSLSQLDQLFLLDIYPAREQPIAGVNSSMLFDKITIANKTLCTFSTIEEELLKHPHEILLFMGAGDISRIVEPLTLAVAQKHE